MTNKIIIMICGKAEHGKTTFANILKKELENKKVRVVKTAFASDLKRVAKEYFGWNGEKDEYGRQLLQHLGTDEVRSFFPNHWVDGVAEVLISTQNRWDVAIIDDWRFQAEFSTMRDYCIPYGVKLLPVRVQRIYNNGEIYQNSLSDEARRHSSECDLDNLMFRHDIVNLDLASLERDARKLIESEILN